MQSDILVVGKAEEVAMHQDHLRHIDVMLEDYVAQQKISGAVALVARKGTIVYERAVGWRDIEQNEPLTTTDMFRIASMTKAMTAVGAMMLLEEGKFGLDDPLWWFIPEMRHMEVLEEIKLTDSSYTSHPARNDIKIRHLFNHTAGFGYGFQDQELNAIYAKHEISEGFEERAITLAESVDRLASLPLKHEPGAQWTYGISYDVLGRLIEIISGMSLNVYFQERIFDPLGMEDTHFYLPEEKFDRLVSVYMSSADGVVPTDYPLINYPVAGAKTYYSGGADITTTAHDYAIFAQMIANKGTYNGKRLLGHKTIEWMTLGQTKAGLDGIGWGFGVIEEQDLHKYPASPGTCRWGGFFSTSCLMDPQEELVAILLLQMYPNWEWNLQNKFENIVYSAINQQK